MLQKYITSWKFEKNVQKTFLKHLFSQNLGQNAIFKQLMISLPVTKNNSL